MTKPFQILSNTVMLEKIELDWVQLGLLRQADDPFLYLDRKIERQIDRSIDHRNGPQEGLA